MEGKLLVNKNNNCFLIKKKILNSFTNIRQIIFLTF